MRSALWAITSYFNPLGYRRRRDSYRVFRERLDVPLVTVEWANGAGPDLSDGDAEVLVRLSEGDLLWQKERLLNVALERLPPECDYVVWLDCDVVFGRRDWPRVLIDQLQRHRLVQPFTTVVDLGPGEAPPEAGSPPETEGRDGPGILRRAALAGLLADGRVPTDAFLGRGWSMKLGYSPGHAWAARRELLDRHGMYDAFILGAGDKLMASAGAGHQRLSPAAYRMTPAQRDHYLAWADPWSESVAGRFGTVDGELYHLYHGGLGRRQYAERYGSDFAAFDFDPYRDIRHASDGAWAWGSDKPDLHRHVAEYFEYRAEDE